MDPELVQRSLAKPPIEKLKSLKDSKFRGVQAKVSAWVQALILFSFSLPHIEWFKVFRKRFSKGSKRSFVSMIGFGEEYWGVLDFVYFRFLQPLKYLPLHFLWFLNYIKEYASWDSLHSKWGVAYSVMKGKVVKVLDILNEKMEFVKMELFVLDITFRVGEHFVFGSVDSVELDTEMVHKKKVKVAKKKVSFDFDESFFQGTKKPFDKNPEFSYKKQKGTYKYEICTTNIIGLCLCLVGPVVGPTSDQILSRFHGLGNKVRAMCFLVDVDIKLLGDGHYTDSSGVVDRTQFINKLERYFGHACRAKVENFNAWIESFKILKTKFRQKRGNREAKMKEHGKVVNVICQLQNLKRLLNFPFYKELSETALDKKKELRKKFKVEALKRYAKKGKAFKGAN